MRKSSSTGSISSRGRGGLRAQGLIHRAVVIASYVQLDGPTAFPESVVAGPTAVYCDVLLYSTSEGLRGAPLRRVLVAQDCGMHDGHPWTPRATKADLSKKSLDLRNCDPQDLDGDHVLIQYLDDSLAQPIITKRLPHPRMGFGNEGLASAGHRMKLKLVDGQPDFWKHHGSFMGFDKDGNLVVDTTRAHSGEYDASGNEIPIADASHGGQTSIVSGKATFKVIGLDVNGANPKFELTVKDNELHLKLADGETLLLSGKDGNTVTTLGDGAKHVAIVEQLQALYESLKAAQELFNTTHTHIDGFGSTATSPTPGTLPAWDPTINSSKVKIPDG